MANIRKLGQSWQARVRRRGFPDETKIFPTKAEAERWARSIEGEMDRGEFVSRTEAEQTTFGQVIQRYMETITPKKRGHVEETIRLTATLLLLFVRPSASWRRLGSGAITFCLASELRTGFPRFFCAHPGI